MVSHHPSFSPCRRVQCSTAVTLPLFSFSPLFSSSTAAPLFYVPISDFVVDVIYQSILRKEFEKVVLPLWTYFSAICIKLEKRVKPILMMPGASISGLSRIIFSKARFIQRVSVLGCERMVRSISSHPYSPETSLVLHYTGGNQRNCHVGKFLPQLSYGSIFYDASLVKRSHAFGPENISLKRGYARDSSNASIELNTDKDVIRFNIGNQSGGRGISLKKGKKTAKDAKMSKKAKVNELRFYRLKARKKMNSPNPEVRIRYKLEKAKRKEVWLIEKLRKYELPKAPPETNDPEILTEEERFYLKRTGEKKKHYVPVGRRGVFGGVVLNMHLHWKRHETVKVVCKPCKPGQVHQYAEEIARMSKGIIIDTKPNNTIIFFRGKNYVQPDVMSPPDTLSKAKALEKYRYEQSLEHTSQFIEKLENELEEYYEHLARYKKEKNPK